MFSFKHVLIFSWLWMAFSCSPYSKVLNKGTVAEKYKMATEYYQEKDFDKALRLFEMVVSSYKGRPQMERIQFMISQSYFNTKDYFNAAYYFERFATNFPKSSKREEAEFFAAKSHFLASPKYSLDPTETKTALSSFQKYINAYPDSKRLAACNKMVKQLQHKLETKAFEIAKQYYEIGYFNAAITAFDNLTSEYLGTSYREQAFYYKFQASYALGINSSQQKKAARIKAAIKAYQKLKRNYPSSNYLEIVERQYRELLDVQHTLTS